MFWKRLMATCKKLQGGTVLDEVLEALRKQLATYQEMARKEREETGGDTYGTCAYLDGAIVASQRAVDLVVRRMRADPSTLLVN